MDTPRPSLSQVADALDTEPEHFELVAPNLTATRIVGLAPRDSFDTFAFSCITVRPAPRRPGTQGENRTFDAKECPISKG